jgi:hypothetical protein
VPLICERGFASTFGATNKGRVQEKPSANRREEAIPKGGKALVEEAGAQAALQN